MTRARILSQCFRVTVSFALVFANSTWAGAETDVASRVAELPETHRDVTVRSLAFSPDGTHIAADSDGEKINIWDWRDRQIELTVEKPRGGGSAITTNSLQYSPNGKLLATCHTNALGGVSNRIWETANGAIAKDIIDPDGGGCNAIGFTPDGAQFLRLANRYAGKGDTFVAYSIDTWSPLWGLRLEGVAPVSIGINPPDSLISIGGTVIVAPEGVVDPIKRIQGSRFLPTVMIVDWQTRKIERTIKGQAMGPMAWSPDKTRIAVAGQLFIEVIDVKSTRILVQQKADTSANMNVRFTQDGRYLIESDSNGKGTGLGVTIWDGSRQKRLQHINGDAPSIDVSRDSKYLAIGANGRTTIWQLK